MLTLLSLNGIAFQYLWPNAVKWANISAPFFIFLDSVALPQFSRSFLDMKKNAKITDKVLLGIMGAGFIGMIISFVASYSICIRIATVVAFLAVVVSFIGGIVCLMKGYRAARFYMIAWTALLLGVAAFALQNAGLLPYNFITKYGHQVGSAAEVILLSFALADRINIMKKEKEDADRELIKVQKTYSESLERTVDERTIELTVERNKLKDQYDIMRHEIALARKIQEQMMPNLRPVEYISSFYRPMEQVGGDFFDFIRFDGLDAIGIFVSDVSGHGVPAAFITSMVKTIILQAGKRKENPAELLRYINDVLQDQIGGNFITAFYGIYDPSGRTIRYSNAGHYQPYVIDGDRVSQLQGGKNTAIAMFPSSFLARSNKTYQNFEEKLPTKSKLLLYTDGLIEARNAVLPKDFFEYDGMLDVFRDASHLDSAAFIDRVYARLVNFRGGDTFEDDICMICLDVR
jgi:serine phosphatase RsbU (regulator of sigma subunit)